MSKISDNLTRRRKELQLSIPEVHIALGKMGHDVAYSTVAAWFIEQLEPSLELLFLCPSRGNDSDQANHVCIHLRNLALIEPGSCRKNPKSGQEFS